ncbi:N-acetylmuramoyl-L-alanine amidase [Stenoxybacter acetivorans]|uniref:N-acetylmuramoyl-L-alanine amidase n=1 Tax=Stenoxybacter acetivorans TaxID=422441 RepID=UPI00056A7C2E|nr:N-acetylmuramoyl-L-alanine amidase [Stenoxybacter acetivorans]
MKTISRRALLKFSSGSLLLGLSPFLRANTAAAADVTAVRIWPANAYTRLTLESDLPIEYKYFALTNPGRLVLDLQGIGINTVLQSLPQKVLPFDPYIGSVRIGQFNENTVRVVMDLKASVNPQVFALKPVADFKNRLVIDLYPSATQQEEADPLMALLQDYNRGKINSDGTSKITDKTTVAQAPTPPVRPAPPEIPEDTPVFISPKNFYRKPIIVLDPGHGGEDPGAIGPSGLREKDVVLAIARETKKRLDELGYKTYLTRNEDVFIPLGVRVAKARKLKADVFISIHADAFTNPAARGTGVYAISQKGATNAAAKYLAQTQNNADLIGGVSYSADKHVNNTLFDLTQTATVNDSLKLGKGVLNALGKINKLHNNTVNQANFAVLKAPDIPSILVETAFISNPTEEKLLGSTQFRQQTALSIVSGVKTYLATAVLARS